MLIVWEKRFLFAPCKGHQALLPRDGRAFFFHKDALVCLMYLMSARIINHNPFFLRFKIWLLLIGVQTCDLIAKSFGIFSDLLIEFYTAAQSLKLLTEL